MRRTPRPLAGLVEPKEDNRIVRAKLRTRRERQPAGCAVDDKRRSSP